MGILRAKKRGIIEHKRFHDLVTQHHDAVRPKYLLYTWLVYASFLLLVASMVFTGRQLSERYSVDFAMFYLAFIFGIAGIGFLLDKIMLKAVGLSSDQQAYMEELPHKLLLCDLYTSEKRFFCPEDSKFFVPDQLFINGDAEIVICDTKTRSRSQLTNSDLEQVGRYAQKLSKLEDRPVSKIAYIRCVTPKGTRFLPIKIVA